MTFRRFFDFPANDEKVGCNTVKCIQRLSRILIGLLSVAWHEFKDHFLWHRVREARADFAVWAYKALCNLKSAFKFHRRFLQREMPMVPKLSIPVTDVRDVAGAHITAMTSPKAPGKKPASIPGISLVFLLWFSLRDRRERRESLGLRLRRDQKACCLPAAGRSFRQFCSVSQMWIF